MYRAFVMEIRLQTFVAKGVRKERENKRPRQSRRVRIPANDGLFLRAQLDRRQVRVGGTVSPYVDSKSRPRQVCISPRTYEGRTYEGTAPSLLR